MINYNISSAIKDIDQKEIFKNAEEEYVYITEYNPVSKSNPTFDSIRYEQKMELSRLTKKAAINSRLVPELKKREIEHILFREFANKAYFDTVFSVEICSPDSVSLRNRKTMRKNLEIFNDSLMLYNFDQIANESSDELYLMPIGLLLIKNGNDYNWYIPIGWEMRGLQISPKEDQKDGKELNCFGLGHIRGDIYSFDFSEMIYQFQCD
jgi:hypothetical protein